MENDLKKDKLKVATAKREPIKIWAILNSNIVILVLSSVVISGVVTAYSEMQEARTERERIQVQIENLDMEIAARVHKANTTLLQGELRKKPIDALIVAFRTLNGKQPVHGEYAEVPLQMLIRNLQRLVPEVKRSNLDVPYDIAMSLITLEPKLTPIVLSDKECEFRTSESGFSDPEYQQDVFQPAFEEFQRLWGKFVRHRRWQQLGAVGVPQHQ